MKNTNCAAIGGTSVSYADNTIASEAGTYALVTSNHDPIIHSINHSIVDSIHETYGLTWKGKAACIKNIDEPSKFELTPKLEDSVNFDQTQNLYIEGDNLEVLKLLQAEYSKKVKLIYIDPPYNTGKQYTYNDKRDQNNAHCNWLSFLYPRIDLAHRLLRDDGVIVISIEDHEIANLRLICDEIFGERNFIGTFVRKKRTPTFNIKNNISIDHDYIVVYSKKEFVSFKGIKKHYSAYKNPNEDPLGEWKYESLTRGNTASDNQNHAYDIVNSETGNVYPVNPNRVWIFNQKTLNEKINQGLIYFPKDKNSSPKLKVYKKDLKKKYDPISSINNGLFGLNGEGTRELIALFGSNLFDYPKPISLIKTFIDQICSKDDIILDFFAGSSTTAHAVMQLNAEDGGNRKFIMVQLPEPTPLVSEARKAGYNTITEIGKERIRRAAKNITSVITDINIDFGMLDFGFKVFTISEKQ